MATWKQDIIKALENLNGIAYLNEIYNEIEKIRIEPLPLTWKNTIRGIIERCSSDSKAYEGKEDIFYSAEGIYNGIWGLRQYKDKLVSFDIEEPPERVEAKIKRIIRDTKLSEGIKKLYNYECQVCGKTIKLKDKNYAEAHHIRPLGNNHNGLDIAENIIVLCPNHHVQFDFGAIELNLSKLKLKRNHKINKQNITYYNENIYEKNV